MALGRGRARLRHGIAAAVAAAALACAAAGPSSATGGAAISLIVDDLGWDLMATVEIAGLPGPLTLSFLPYPSELPVQIALARKCSRCCCARMR